MEKWRRLPIAKDLVNVRNGRQGLKIGWSPLVNIQVPPRPQGAVTQDRPQRVLAETFTPRTLVQQEALNENPTVCLPTCISEARDITMSKTWTLTS